MNTKTLLLLVLFTLIHSSISSISSKVVNHPLVDFNVGRSLASIEYQTINKVTANTANHPFNEKALNQPDGEDGHEENKSICPLRIRSGFLRRKNSKGFLYGLFLAISFSILLFMICCMSNHLPATTGNESQIDIPLQELPREKQSMLNPLNQKDSDPYGWTNWQYGTAKHVSGFVMVSCLN